MALHITISHLSIHSLADISSVVFHILFFDTLLLLIITTAKKKLTYT